MLQGDELAFCPGPEGEAVVQELLAELDRVASAANLLGYLNFSDGRPDPRWQKQLNDSYAFLTGRGDAVPWQTLHQWLNARLTTLQEGGSPGFKKVTQARAALEMVFNRVLPAYRAHHADLFFHLSDRDLFQPFFLARVCEAVLAQGVPNQEEAPAVRRAVVEVLARLNDYVGYRPVAILENRPRGEPYDHERLRPIPLFLRGAGVASGRYQAVVAKALEILAETDPTLLNEAQFDPRLLDELAVDPRAYDHTHPVNRRPNFVFGEWDPHHLDTQGRYRRYVVRQITLDALMERVEPPGSLDPGEALHEAAAVLAGTLLMATGISGSSPSAYDSSVTLSSLMPRIARYRDAFYTKLLRKLGGTHGQRLQQEATATRQPFGAARQQFNRFLARHRALQLQQRHLAILYAEMGHAEAGQEEAARIPTASLRLLSAIQGRLATGRLLAENGDLGKAEPLLGEIGDLLRRGIACGAFVDPWNILGFQGLFPLFASREDSVRDHRIDELIHLVEQTFDLYARLMSEAAARGNRELREQLAAGVRQLADWWDPYGSTNVGDVRAVLGSEAAASAEQVATALARWHERGQASADLGFWKQHLQGFRSAKAFALVLDALLRKDDYRASMALLASWVGQAEQVPLEDGDHSFSALALRWMLGLTTRGSGGAADAWPLIQRFFDYLEANAEDYWQVPSLDSQKHVEEETDEPDNLYEAAYEDVIYRDSSDDGREGETVGEDIPYDSFDLEDEAPRLDKHLRFLSTLARLWQIAARHDAGVPREASRAAVIAGWLKTASSQQQQLLSLLDAIHAYPVPEPIGMQEAVMEYDRRRVLKEQLTYAAVGACLDNTLAVCALQGALPGEGPAEPAKGLQGPVQDAKWGPLAIQLESALFRGDVSAARDVLPAFLALFREEPLLFQPLSDGGQPRQILRVRVCQAILRALAANLPRLGLLRETYHLLRSAWASEQAHPPKGRGVTEFNHLFQAAFQAVLEAVVESSATWSFEREKNQRLVGLLERLTSPFLTLWVEHSRSLQLSALESVRGDQQWKVVRSFIERFGRDLFQARFMTLANLRGILHRGIGPHLDYLSENRDPLQPNRLVDELDQPGRREEATACLQLILQAVVENYEEYKDYNTTTTQSDYGENLYVLLDFLRLKASYDRHAWQFRPLLLAHEVLARTGNEAAALQWEQSFLQVSRELAEIHLGDLKKLEQTHATRLTTVADRLEERFVKPLRMDRLCALIGPAVQEARQPGSHPIFIRLRQALQTLAASPTGAGLDVPHWLRRLENEAQRVQASQSAVALLAEELFRVPKRSITEEDLLQQLRDWDVPLSAV
jgi:hypothetical protein